MFINGEFVDDALVRLEAARIKERLGGGETDLATELNVREAARNAVIERIVLRQAAERDPTPIPAAAVEAALKQYGDRSPQPHDTEGLRANIERDLRIERLLDAITAHLPKPSRKQIARFYDFSKETLMLPEVIHVAHIVKNVDESMAEDEARAAMQKIETLLGEGKPFEQVADELSDCPGRGGDLGFIQRGEMVEEFEQAAFGLDPGSVSAIFRTPFGFHIAKVYERRAPRVPALNEVKQRLEESLWEQAKKQTFRAFVDDLRVKAEVRRSK